jgi:uncharacterized phage-associated protein
MANQKKTTNQKGLGVLDSIELANYILAKVKNVDQLKLQKLIYYTEAWHLAYFKKSIIEDDFEAWVHGPVSRKIWIKFRGDSILYSNINPKLTLKETEKKIKNRINDSQFDLLNEVLEVYGKYSSFKLEELTHSEKPWLSARKGLRQSEPSSKCINKITMGNFYRKYAQENKN